MGNLLGGGSAAQQSQLDPMSQMRLAQQLNAETARELQRYNARKINEAMYSAYGATTATEPSPGKPDVITLEKLKAAVKTFGLNEGKTLDMLKRHGYLYSDFANEWRKHNEEPLAPPAKSNIDKLRAEVAAWTRRPA